ncbi:MAG: hypothetical protein J7L45_00760 [Candidatus Aenigmarchaeota archaeon]|nr:hypothetical protein [Candidatus Aenigmarchaeota archaeon]
MRNDMKFAIFVFLIIGVVFTSGCTEKPSPVNSLGLVLPKHDVTGSDIKEVPRYSGMIRFSYSEDECSQSVSYYSNGNMVDEIKSFYLNSLKSSGWKLNSQSGVSSPGVFLPYFGSVQPIENVELSFSKGDYSIDLVIQHIKVSDNDYTVLNIDYSKPCGESNEGGSQETQENPYYTASEVQPTDDYSKELNGVLKPILKSVFGGAKLIKSEYATSQGATGAGLTYVVMRPVEQKDGSTLIDLIEKEGYQVIVSDVSSEGISVTFMKDGKPTLSLDARVGDYEINFVGYQIKIKGG